MVMLVRLLKRLVRTGSLRLIDGRGKIHIFGDGSAPRVALRLHKWWLEYKLAAYPSLYLGEAYADGALTFEEGALSDLLDLLARNYDDIRAHPLIRAIDRVELLLRPYNSIVAARRNVAHHYDLSGRLYELFLDSDLQYSCAYFETGRESLDQAQTKKKSHIARKLLLDRPGLSVLDIGCGWGGLALYLARTAGSDVTGITLSEEQYKTATARALKEGLPNSARFELRDYRQVAGRFDRIVSVGMFEHVGKAHYREFFRRLSGLLTDDGVALVHTIAWTHDLGPINPFIRKYIFPGAELSSLPEILAAVERSGLIVSDVEILRQHYAITLHHWRLRFESNRAKIIALYDERFFRTWQYYLASSETFFRHGKMAVLQIQLAKNAARLPITRDYMYGRDERGARQRFVANA